MAAAQHNEVQTRESCEVSCFWFQLILKVCNVAVNYFQFVVQVSHDIYTMSEKTVHQFIMCSVFRYPASVFVFYIR